MSLPCFLLEKRTSRRVILLVTTWATAGSRRWSGGLSPQSVPFLEVSVNGIENYLES